jgi:hypothetical protein
VRPTSSSRVAGAAASQRQHGGLCLCTTGRLEQRGQCPASTAAAGVGVGVRAARADLRPSRISTRQGARTHGAVRQAGSSIDRASREPRAGSTGRVAGRRAATDSGHARTAPHRSPEERTRAAVFRGSKASRIPDPAICRPSRTTAQLQ